MAILDGQAHLHRKEGSRWWRMVLARCWVSNKRHCSRQCASPLILGRLRLFFWVCKSRQKLTILSFALLNANKKHSLKFKEGFKPPLTFNCQLEMNHPGSPSTSWAQTNTGLSQASPKSVACSARWSVHGSLKTTLGGRPG